MDCILANFYQNNNGPTLTGSPKIWVLCIERKGGFKRSLEDAKEEVEKERGWQNALRERGRERCICCDLWSNGIHFDILIILGGWKNFFALHCQTKCSYQIGWMFLEKKCIPCRGYPWKWLSPSLPTKSEHRRALQPLWSWGVVECHFFNFLLHYLGCFVNKNWYMSPSISIIAITHRRHRSTNSLGSSCTCIAVLWGHLAAHRPSKSPEQNVSVEAVDLNGMPLDSLAAALEAAFGPPMRGSFEPIPVAPLRETIGLYIWYITLSTFVMPLIILVHCVPGHPIYCSAHTRFSQLLPIFLCCILAFWHWGWH